jgi:hypothetical protein
MRQNDIASQVHLHIAEHLVVTAGGTWYLKHPPPYDPHRILGIGLR